jgi:hypothetical protein
LIPTILAKPLLVKLKRVSDGGLTSVADSFIQAGGTGGLNESIWRNNRRATTCREVAGCFNRHRSSGSTGCRAGCDTIPYHIVSEPEMAKIVDLNTYRRRIFLDRAFGPWKKRFKETYDATLQLADLSDKTLLFLARPGDAGTLAFYEIIMGTLGIGTAAEFYTLDKQNQLKVVDIHLFLVDQVRFELMRRLGWVTRFPCQAHTLVGLIQDAERLKTESRGCPPDLSTSHADYATFRNLTALDKESFIRRLLSEALESFANQFD